LHNYDDDFQILGAEIKNLDPFPRKPPFWARFLQNEEDFPPKCLSLSWLHGDILVGP